MSPMKFIVVALSLASVFQTCAAAQVAKVDEGPATVGKVVEFLNKLLSRSKEEGEAEGKMYAKFKCYCDDNDKATSADLKELSEGISKLGSEIEGLQSANGELSTQCAKLKSDIADNEASQEQASAIRSKASKEFKAEAADLRKAIHQMAQAIQMLSEAGGDQTRNSGADHARFMAGHKSASLLSLDADMKQALEAAFALLPVEQRPSVDSFLQAPFTGSYSSQSGAVVGILKSMRDTFKSNLQEATETEERDAKANAALMSNLEGMEKEMKKAYEDKQEELGGNDSGLAARKLQLNSAKDSEESALDFLEKLRPDCQKKAQEFEARKLLRANEQAAIAQAVSILDPDAADAPSFLQLTSARRADGPRLQAQLVLQQALLRDGTTTRLASLVAMLQGENPFSVVFTEIQKMVALVSKEQHSDEENHAFCKEQTNGEQKKLKEIRNTIDKLEVGLDELRDTVDKPQTGLKAQEASLEQAMATNTENQKKAADMRHDDKLQHQKSVEQLTKTEALLGKAITVLKKFYSSLHKKSGLVAAAALQQKARPKPPETWDSAYDGQSNSATGEKGAVEMIEYIRKETDEQITQAQKEEGEAQADFEGNMAELMEEQRKQMKNMVSLKSALADAEQGMVDKKGDLKQEKLDETATSNYLADIKPRCDFIFDNFELRTRNRKSETKALVQAEKLLKASPAYQAASLEADAEALGACRGKCEVPDHAVCKACLAHVSVPGYCAGHNGTRGC